MKIHSLNMFSLVCTENQQRLPHTTTIHVECFVARAKIAQVGEILEYPHNELSMEDNIRVLVLCVNDSSPTEFTTLKESQRTFREDIVFSLYTQVQFVTVQLTAK